MNQDSEFIAEPCLNCGDTTPGRYCRACGQRKGEVRVSMRRLIADVLEDQLSINSALPRTLAALFLKPGKLTSEYARGRIAAYIAPFRLYLVASLLFFLVASVASRLGLDDEITINGGDSPPAAADTATVPGLPVEAGTLTDAAVDPTGLQTDPVPAGSTIPDPAATEAAAEEAGPAQDDDEAEAEQRRRPIGIVITDGDLEGDSIDWSQVVNTGIPVLDTLIAGRAQRLSGMKPREAVRELLGSFLGYAPTAMFVLLPVFAVLLKILYFRSRRYYVEHFVFALHFHAFAFLIFVVIIVLPDVMRPELLLLWLFVYLPIALKRVYGQGFFKTFAKWVVLATVYNIIMIFGIFATLVAAFAVG